MLDFKVNYDTGNALYVIVERMSDGDSHTIVLTDVGDGTYTGNMPEDAGLGMYRCKFYKQSGASPDADTDILLFFETRVWSGEAFDFDKAVAAAQGTYKPTGMTFGGIRG